MPPTSKQPTPADQQPPAGTDPPPATQSADAAELERLRAENADLRARLAAAEQAGQPVQPAKPVEPSYTFSEGQRDELERTGRTVSPFTGQRFVGTSPDDAREATAEEFAKAKPPERSTTKAKPGSRGRRS